MCVAFNGQKLMGLHTVNAKCVFICVRCSVRCCCCRCCSSIHTLHPYISVATHKMHHSLFLFLPFFAVLLCWRAHCLAAFLLLLLPHVSVQSFVLSSSRLVRLFVRSDLSGFSILYECAQARTLTQNFEWMENCNARLCDSSA